MRWLMLITAYAFAATGWSAPRAPFRYQLAPLPALGPSHCKALALNDQGLAVGRFQMSVFFGQPPERAGWLKDGERAPISLPLQSRGGRDLARRGEVHSQATDLNNHGVAVGWVRTNLLSSGRRAMAVEWGKNGFEPIAIPGAVQSFAYGVNDRREIVGAYEDKDGFLRAFARGDRFDGTRDLGTLGGKSARAYDLNDHGVVVGVSTLTNGQRRAFVYRNGKMKSLGTLGGQASQANAVNSQGHVVGVSQTKYGVFHAFKYDGAGLRDLGTLGGSFSYPYALQADFVVGVSEDRNRLRRGFFSNGRHMWDLNLLVKQPRNWFVSEAVDINSVGEILAMARNPQGALQPVRLIPIRR